MMMKKISGKPGTWGVGGGGQHSTLIDSIMGVNPNAESELFRNCSFKELQIVHS